MNHFSKILATLALIMTLLLPSISNAQYSLVVANGTTTNFCVPIRGSFCNAYLRAQFVYPATDIEIMSGGTISQMKFFSTTNNCSWANTDFRVYIKEISETIISGYENSSTMTLVYSGPLSVADSHLTITFTTPYVYMGGNLLIEVANVAKGSSINCDFYGIYSPGSSIQGGNSSSINGVSASQNNFLPKVQFDFSSNNLNIDGDFIYSDATKHKLLQYTGQGGIVTIASTVDIIGAFAFQGCSNLTSVTIPSSVTSIGRGAFCGCINLSSMIIPNSVTSIGGYAFYGCSSLTSVTIPNSVTSIGDHAFNNCGGLTSVTIPNSVTSIGGYAFYGCSSLSSVTIPNSVTSIGDHAFYNCGGLTSVTIPNSVTSIGDYAFNNCSGLTSVTIGNSVSSIGDRAFQGCGGLTSVTIPNSVTSIGYSAFYNCIGLTSVTIPNSVTSIGNYAFYGCSGLLEIWLKPTTPPTLGYTSLGADSVPLIVPHSSYNAYTGAGFYCTNHPIFRDSIIVTALVNDTLMGYVSGGDTTLVYPYQNDTVTLTATAIAFYGYHFVRWDDNSTDNPLLIVADSDITRIAIFDKNQFHILATSDTTIHGVINVNSGVWGDGDFNVVDVSREYLKQITLTAKPNHGYHFTHWQDGDTNNPRTFILTQDTSFTAYYDKNTYTLTFQSADTNMGVVNTASITGEYLDTTMLINATALPHYHFDHWDWGCWYCNSTENPRRFVIDDNRTYTAYFSIDVHTVNVQIDNIAHGTVDGSGSREYGQPITVSATPYSGYQFSHWSDGSTYNPYTFAVVNNVQLTAHFYAIGTPYQDTLYLDTLTIHDTVYMNVYLHDTTYVPVHDTTYINIHDTTYIIQTDTLWLHDTIIIHDTIYITQEGNDGVDVLDAKIYSNSGQIVVEGAEQNAVTLFDINGRALATKQDYGAPLRFDVPATGTYMVKIGDHPARKVVVIR